MKCVCVLSKQLSFNYTQPPQLARLIENMMLMLRKAHKLPMGTLMSTYVSNHQYSSMLMNVLLLLSADKSVIDKVGHFELKTRCCLLNTEGRNLVICQEVVDPVPWRCVCVCGAGVRVCVCVCALFIVLFMQI